MVAVQSLTMRSRRAPNEPGACTANLTISIGALCSLHQKVQGLGLRGFREPNTGALIISNRVWGSIGNIIKAPKLKPQTLNRSGFGVSRLGRGPGPRACFMRVSHMMVTGLSNSDHSKGNWTYSYL